MMRTERNPDWTRDELILALDMYLAHAGSPPGKGSKEIHALSDLLNQLGRRLGVTGDERYRNPNGVYMKLMNFRRFDSTYGGVGLRRGGHEEERVWADFATDRERCRAVAAAIRAAVVSGEPLAVSPEDEDEMFEAEEGRLLTRLHHSRERNRRLVAKCKERCIKKQGRVSCEACGFDFERIYGERGRGFIECHHTRPVHTLRPGDKTRLEDLALLCANCHRMIHAGRSWLTVAALKALLAP
jgi:5-methylcytosine-specific restriction protein A